MKTEVIDAVLELETLGYSFTLEADSINFTHQGIKPGSAIVRPLLRMIQENRDDALEWLRDDAEAFRMDCLFNAADRAEIAARQAEIANDRVLARFHWKRFARFFAPAIVMAGGTEPFIPWDEWIRSFDDEVVLIYDREPALQLQE